MNLIDLWYKCLKDEKNFLFDAGFSTVPRVYITIVRDSCEGEIRTEFYLRHNNRLSFGDLKYMVIDDTEYNELKTAFTKEKMRREEVAKEIQKQKEQVLINLIIAE